MKSALFAFYNALTQTIFKKPRAYKIPFGPLKGTYIYTTPRHGVRKILGNYEVNVLEVLKNNIKEGDVCIDAGAHVGIITLYMRKLVGNTGKVFAYEPVPECFGFIKHSIKKNNYKNVIVYDIALGNEKKEEEAHVFEDSGMANFDDSGFEIYGEKQKKVTFKLDTLDNVHEGPVDFIKIDIEGYEANLLEGGIKTIEKFKPKMLIEIHNTENYQRIFRFLKNLNYNFKALDGTTLTENLELKEIIHIIANHA